MKLTIQTIRALEILDSRGNPTLEVEIRLASGLAARAQVPSGASTGSGEALELRDGDPARFGGKGVLKAVENVETELARALEGKDALAQAELDRLMIDLDGTANKSRLGANAILGVSCALARVSALAMGVPLYTRLSEIGGTKPCLPVPMVNILSGGHHAGFNMEVQDFLVFPLGLGSFRNALRSARDVLFAARDLLTEAGKTPRGAADEGGWGPDLDSNTEALDLLNRAIERAGYRPQVDVFIAVDAAASHFYSDGKYRLPSEGREADSLQMIDLYRDWVDRYPVVSIEDGLEESNVSDWKEMTSALGGKIQVVGDDFLTTNPARVEQAAEDRSANAILIKMNQIGTLTETFEVIRIATRSGWRGVVSARSGETEDSFLADLAVASGCGQIKVGSVTRSERLAKYNHLLWLERDSGLEWAGGVRFPPLIRG